MNRQYSQQNTNSDMRGRGRGRGRGERGNRGNNYHQQHYSDRQQNSNNWHQSQTHDARNMQNVEDAGMNWREQRPRGRGHRNTYSQQTEIPDTVKVCSDSTENWGDSGAVFQEDTSCAASGGHNSNTSFDNDCNGANSWATSGNSKNSWAKSGGGSTSWGKQSRGSTSRGKQSGNSTSWDKQSSGSTSWGNQGGSSTSWGNQGGSSTSWGGGQSTGWGDLTTTFDDCCIGEDEKKALLEQEKVWAWKKGYEKRKKDKIAKAEADHAALPEATDWDAYSEQQEKKKRDMTASYPPIVKNTYIEDEAVANMTSSQVSTLRKQLNRMTVTDIDGKTVQALHPVRTFDEAFQHYEKFLNVIKKHNFKNPSPVQCQLWPLIMSGQDVIGIAQTGTGKTLAYLIPGLIHIERSEYYHSKTRDGPCALILAPTRELAQQIHNEIAKFSVRNIKTVCVYGQGNRDEQLMALEGSDIVVATPGRLIDFVSCGDVNLEGVSYFVLDEADRMLDLGFHADIMKIYNRMRIDRQVILTSATWKYMLNFTAKNMMKDPVKVNIGELDLAAVETVTQRVIVCEENEKDEMLFDLLNSLSADDKVIVFVNRKATADFLSMQSVEKQLPDIEIMHGGLDQSDREAALCNLKNGSIRILIATDLASRGLDVLDLTKVINLDMPRNLEEYVHRSGRTGRAGRSGEVISFVTWDDRRNVSELIKIMERSDQEIPEELSRMSQRAERWIANKRERGDSRGGRGGRGRGGRGYGQQSYGMENFTFN